LRAATRKLHHRLFVFSFKQTTQPPSAVVVLVVVVVGLEARLLFIYQATTNEQKKFSVVCKTRVVRRNKKKGEHKC